jgi:hypothetical protein
MRIPHDELERFYFALRRAAERSAKVSIRAPQVTTFQSRHLQAMLEQFSSNWQSAVTPLRDAAGRHFVMCGVSKCGGPDVASP